jgi:GTP cyclohydrolase I
MIDIQAGGDVRGVAIPAVGISGLRHYVLTGDTRNQRHVVADLNLSVSLPAERRGTHMSRLVELVLEQDDDLTLPRLPVVVKRLLGHLDAEAGAVRIAFPLVSSRPAPVTGVTAANVHDAALAVRCVGEEVEVSVEVEVVATSLCPCSKAISDYGAHNQRSRVTVSVTAVGGDATARLPSLDELVAWVEDACSCPVYPLLKRPDERHVTERAYENPAFVEDIARDLAVRLQPLEGPGEFSVRVVNEESIHRHDAFATVSGPLRQTLEPLLSARP